MNEGRFYHSPVLLNEVINWLKVKSGGVYLDGTLGGGGHASEILKCSSPDGRLIGIDKDRDAISHSKNALSSYAGRFEFSECAFSNVLDVAKKFGIKNFDGILLDLGVSAHQLDEGSRGFSFMKSGPIDMRMGDESVSLLDKLGDVDLNSLMKIISEFGEERRAKRIAAAIIEARGKGELTDTLSLARVVENAVGGRRGRIHPATQTFQALRIWVNRELDELRSFLNVAPGLLAPSGRMVIISYHSLEDRIVKHSFRELAKRHGFLLPVKKIIIPSAGEIAENSRSRSAKMRVIEKI